MDNNDTEILAYHQLKTKSCCTDKTKANPDTSKSESLEDKVARKRPMEHKETAKNQNPYVRPSPDKFYVVTKSDIHPMSAQIEKLSTYWTKIAMTKQNAMQPGVMIMAIMLKMKGTSRVTWCDD